MKTDFGMRVRRMAFGSVALVVVPLSGTAYAAAPTSAVGVAVDPALAPSSDTAPQTQATGIAEGADIVVTATKANEIAPVTASLQTTQPQSVISRSFIEDSLPATADFNQIAAISSSVSITGERERRRPVGVEGTDPRLPGRRVQRHL